MKLRRQYQMYLNNAGSATIEISPNNAAMEWEIHQVSVSTKSPVQGCIAALYHNGAYLHSTPIGSLDSATGPPYPIVNTNDVFSIEWTNGVPNDQATATIWYNENPTGTSTGL